MSASAFPDRRCDAIVSELLFGICQTSPERPTKQKVTTEQAVDPRLAARL